MPDDRLLHRRSLHSEKVCGLTDFEYRVWMTYQLASDDYGVMRLSAAALRSANDAFEKKPAGVLERAFQRLVAVGLLRVFDHQGKSYVYQHDWQAWQRVRNPRTSVQPLPTFDDIEVCEASTRELFTSRLEYMAAKETNTSTNSSIDAATVQQRCGPHGKRLEANGDRPMANGSDIRDRFERFWESYPRKVGKGQAWRSWLKIRPDDALSAVIVASVEAHRSDPQWVKDGGQFIPHPSTFLNQERWTDQPVEVPQVSDKTLRNMKAIYGT